MARREASPVPEMERYMAKVSTTHRKVYGITNVVETTSMCRSFIYQEIKAGRLKVFKIGKRTLIANEDLENWLNTYRRA